MNTFSYLSVLTSIILALGITRVLTGIGRLLQFRGYVYVYWVHLLWSLNVFLYLVLNWWILFRWTEQGQWTLFLFLFVLLSVLLHDLYIGQSARDRVAIVVPAQSKISSSWHTYPHCGMNSGGGG
jgi:hypothetical protein